MKPYVVLLGYRQALARALHRLGIAFSVWSEQPLKSLPAGIDQLIVEKFPASLAAGEPAFRTGVLTQTPTHVIAGTEAAVFPAAFLRRHFGARRSPDTLLRRCTDKAAMKTYLRKFGIPMTRYVTHNPTLRAAGLVAELGLPVVVKKKRGSGGRDIVIARSVEELERHMHRGNIYEAFVDAAEGSIETVMDSGRILFTNVTDYFEKTFSNIVPAGFAAEETEAIHLLNRRVIEALKIEWGLTHLEYYRSAGGILFGEIALRPPGGYIMRLIQEAYGFDPWELLVRVELGMDPPPPPAAAGRVAGCLILHPGAGTVCQVTRPVRDDYPSLIRCSLKATVGDTVAARAGVGEDRGYCLFADRDRDRVIVDIRRLQAAPPVRTRS